MKKQEKWWIVYKEIGKGLQKIDIDFKDRAPNILFNMCIEDAAFIAANKWIEKFQKRSYRLDPLHIFASISPNNLKEPDRIKRINILLRLFGSNMYVDTIDFSGCPTPPVISIIGARNLKHQLEIWKLFSKVFVGKDANEINFEQYKSWYGVGFSAFTLFLFWTNSGKYLPIDSNTKDFLKRHSQRIPKDYQSYQDKITIIRKRNSSKDEGFGKYGLFREISLYAYNSLNDIKTTQQKSLSYEKYIDNIIFENNDDPIQFRGGEESPKVQEAILDIPNLLNDEDQQLLSNLGFKLIAVVPQEGCQYLKILKHEPFYFEKTFSISKEEQVTFHPEKQQPLYNMYLGTQLLRVNITAIVGKNGSGKSSLIELLFRMINNITAAFQAKLNTTEIEIEKGINAKLYYIADSFLYCIHVEDSGNTIQAYTFTDNTFTKRGIARPLTYEDLHSFFYTIAVNYSHFALNSNDLGPWIQHLFHKNDAYQAPIVINPMRTEGIIDINNEDKLVKSRLLVNLFTPVEEDDIGIRQLTDRHSAKEVRFTLNENKSKVRVGENEYKDVLSIYQLRSSYKTIFKPIYKHFKFSETDYDAKNEICKHAERYILKKMIVIAERYTMYNEYLYIDKTTSINNEVSSLALAKIDAYVAALYDDSSHITYKLKQAIYYLKYYNLVPKKQEFTLALDDLEEMRRDIANDGNPELEHIPLIELLPPSIFDIQIIMEDKEGKESDFKDLSSGQKQQIYSLTSMLYHIQNLDSVESANDLISYSNLNFILDEIELYYHPEMQRKYIDYLLTMLGKLSLHQVRNINICMVTHSPYILSDIPNNYLLRLDDGRVSTRKENKTFGANIHDLLANDFFMTSTTGEFAQTKIKTIVDFYYEVKRAFTETDAKDTTNVEEADAFKARQNELLATYEAQKKEFHYIVVNIGEAVIQSVLQNHIQYMEEKFYADKRDKIARLEQEIALKRQELENLKRND